MLKNIYFKLCFLVKCFMKNLIIFALDSGLLRPYVLINVHLCVLDYQNTFFVQSFTITSRYFTILIQDRYTDWYYSTPCDFLTTLTINIHLYVLDYQNTNFRTVRYNYK
jgi:hypothetical protein